MKQLILTSIDSIPEERRVEHLGPWSLSESQLFGWEWKKFGIEPPLQSEEVHFVSRRLEKVCEFYLSWLSIRQNERHERSYSNRYWRILLMPWLVNLVMCAFERFLRVRDRVRSGVPYLVYLAPRDETLFSITTPHFSQMMIDDPLNRLIFSRFIRAFRPQSWVMREGTPAPEDSYFFSNPTRDASKTENYAVYKKVQRKMEVYRWASILSSNLGYVQFHKVHGLSPLDAICISLRIALRSRRRWREAARSFQETPETENAPLTRKDVVGELQSLQNIASKEAGIFLSVLDELVSETMPKIFTDHYLENEKKALLKVKATAPWTDTIAYGHLGNDDPSNFFVAALLEKRSLRLVVNQHGGNYGIVESAPWHQLSEFETADRFISWGWKRQSDYRISAVPASSPFLTKMKRSKKRDSSIILVSSELPLYLKWLAADCLSEDIVHYMREKSSFIEHLGDGPSSALWYRPYMRRRNNLYDQAYIERRFSDVRILRGKLARYMPSRLSPELAGCGVCVLDRPGTTAAFMIAAGIPTLFFGHQSAWRVSNHAKPYFNKLAGVRVHHSSGESAAKHLNAIWPDVDSWWEDGRTRKVVTEFAHRYYRTSKNWRAEWVEIFSSPNSKLWRTDKMDAV
ncbi:MAG: LIC12162 family protein [Nitrospinae bacterium]|nr:LIC12162 family protein [Nitrospinota bacterium]